MEPVPTKMTFDTAIGVLLAIGVIAMWTCMLNHDWFYVPIGLICILVALILSYHRNKWNEHRKGKL